MNHPDTFPAPFRLQQWLVRPDLNRIGGPEGMVQVEPRVMAVLLVLAARPGAVVSRLEILDEVWGDAVVGEEILTRAVSELRRIFGDDARRPRFIETIRAHGYRLIARPEPVDGGKAGGGEAVPPVVVGSAADTGPDAGAAPDAPPPPLAAAPAPGATGVPAGEEPTPVRGRGGSWLRLLIGLLALVVLAWFGLRVAQREREAGRPAPLAHSRAPAVPLTSFAGREYHPALSPDGTRVAFAWSGPDGGRSAIYVKQRDNETPLRLENEPGWAAWPTWSPDGQSVAFVQTADTVSAICIVPSLGGAVRRVHRVADLVEGLDWSPDGTRLAYAARERESGRYSIFLLDLASLAVTPFPDLRPDDAGDLQPRFSPDGVLLAWIGQDGTGGSGIYTARIAGGPVRQLVTGMDRLQGLSWTPDGAELVYAAAPAGLFKLWSVPAVGGPPREVATAGGFAWNPTVARRSGDLVYEQVQVDQDLWRVALRDRKTWQVERTVFAPSTRWEYGADYAPGGKSVALVSGRSGNPEIWLADAEGHDLRRLTTLGAAAIANARWSPDGRELAFNAVIGDDRRILVIAAAGGAPRPVTTGADREVFGSWSADGRSLLVGADGEQGWQVYRVATDGTSVRQLTRSGGLVAAEDPSERTLYYTRPDRPGLWRQQPGGRLEPELVLPDLQPRDRYDWRFHDGRLVWVMRSGGTSYLLEYDPATRHSVLLADLPGLSDGGLAAAPGKDVFIYPRLGEAAGDLMLIPGWSKPSGST